MEDLKLYKPDGTLGLEFQSDGPQARPVVILLRLINDALDSTATDIHIEPEGRKSVVRYRVDGFLRPAAAYEHDLGRQLLQCVKVLCDLDITNKNRFQDGSFRGIRANHEIDFRVSVMQEVGGDKMVIRILDRTVGTNLIERLGMHQDLVDTLRAFARRTQGTLIVAGPTGAGKTTTLYGILNEIDRARRNAISIEDPVEYHLPLMTQIHVDPKLKMTFAASLRSALRQDPNVLMIGEIRDAETADIALQSALTGHLVLTTTHAKDAIGAIFRLVDLKIPPYQLVSSVDLILAQRLARKLCVQCKQPMSVTPRYFELLGFPVPQTDTVYRARGCAACGDTGYSGRTGISELLQMNDALREAILRKAPETELQAMVNSGPYARMIHDAMRKVEAGIMSMEEVSRVLG